MAASAHDWPEAIRQLKEAIAECGDCAAKADLHKKLGLIDCQTGDLDNGEKELLAAKALKPADPEIQRALQLIAQARKQHSGSAPGKAQLVLATPEARAACRDARSAVRAAGSRTEAAFPDGFGTPRISPCALFRQA